MARNPSSSYGDSDNLPAFEVDADIDDCSLSDAIADDARMLKARRRKVEFDRYLTAIMNLGQYETAIDTAIHVTLVSMMEHGEGDLDQCAEAMIRSYPQHTTRIRIAMAITEVFEFRTLGQSIVKHAGPLELPCPFGPILPDGTARYELRELLGQGAEGTVYLAVDRNFFDPTKPALVAIKLLPKDATASQRRLSQIDEASRARRISHRNVIRAVDRGVYEGRPYAVYDYVDGTPLDIHCEHHPLSHREIVRIVREIAEGVHAIHAARLVHCDLKPSNILIDKSGTARIADFGLAAYQANVVDGSDADNHKSNRHGYGTLAFVAPEQFRREHGAIAPTADIYAVGGILFWLLARRAPNGATPEEARRNLGLKSGREGPPRLSEFGKFDPDLAAICERALHPDPDQRPGSVAQIASDLEKWLDRWPLEWTRPTRRRRLHLFIRREPKLAASLVAVVVALVGGTAALSRSAASAEADAAKAQLVLAEQKIQGQQQTQFLMSSFIKTMRDGFSRTPVGEHGEGWLPLVSMMETISNPLGLTDNERSQFWERRIEAIELMKAAAETRGSHASIEYAMWEFLNGFWLMQKGKYVESSTMLRANVKTWNELVPLTDPWLDYVHAAVDISEALELTQRVGPMDEFNLESLRTRLGMTAIEFADNRPADPIFIWTFRALEALESVSPDTNTARVREWRRLAPAKRTKPR